MKIENIDINRCMDRNEQCESHWNFNRNYANVRERETHRWQFTDQQLSALRIGNLKQKQGENINFVESGLAVPQ